MHCDMRAFASQIMEEVKYSESREHPGNKENRETSYKKTVILLHSVCDPKPVPVQF